METTEIIDNVEKAPEIIEEKAPEIIEEPIEKAPKMTRQPNYKGELKTPDGYWELAFKKNTRNSLLEKTDKYLLPDFPITEEKRNEIKEYREYLRNFININTEAILRGEDVEILPIPLP